MRLAPDENASLFSGRNFDLVGDEHIHVKLYRCQQIDIGLRYIQGCSALQHHSGSELVVFSTSAGPGKRRGTRS